MPIPADFRSPDAERDWRRFTIAKITFYVIAVTLLAIQIFMIHNVYWVESRVADLQKEIAKSQSLVLAEMTRVREASTINLTSNRKTIKSLREELEGARQELAAATGEAKLEARGTVQRLARELHIEEQRQREQHEQVRMQLSDVKQNVTSADAKIADVSSDVNAIKNEAATTKNDLTKAITDLHRVKGDMGVMSGLIATNAKELDLLRALGDRDYTEFRLKKTREPQNIGHISVLLKKTDPQGRRYTMDVITGDSRVRKKDKTANEPIQFYVAKNRQPFEIVVNSVNKDEVNGYLATPKVEAVRQ